MDFLTCGETRKRASSRLLNSTDKLQQDSILNDKQVSPLPKDNDVRISMDFYGNAKHLSFDMALPAENQSLCFEKFHPADSNLIDLATLNFSSGHKCEGLKDPAFHFTGDNHWDLDAKEFGAMLGELVKMDSSEEHLTRLNLREVRVKRFACPFPGCSTTKRSKTHLDSHIKLHCRGGKRFFTCSDCGRTFYSSGSLKSHKTTHIRQTETYPCKVEACGKVYATLEGLRLHNRNYHQVNKPWKCMVYGCTSEFVRKADLTLHLIRMHQKQRPFPCKKEGCDKSFASNAELRRHLARYHHIKQQDLCGRRRTTHQVSTFVEEMLERAKQFREQRNINEKELEEFPDPMATDF